MPLRLLAVQHCLTECSTIVSEMFFLATHTHLQALMPVLSWHYQGSKFPDANLTHILSSEDPWMVCWWQHQRLMASHCARGKDPVSAHTGNRTSTTAAARLAAIAGRLSTANTCWFEDVSIWKRKMLFRVQEICFTWEHTTHAVVNLALSMKRHVHGERCPLYLPYSFLGSCTVIPLSACSHFTIIPIFPLRGTNLNSESGSRNSINPKALDTADVFSNN